MAAIVRETHVAQLSSGQNGRIRVSGSAALSGGTATFNISPGYNDVNITSPVSSTRLRMIDNMGVTCSSATNATMIQIANLYYNTTNDAQFITIDCVADQNYDWYVEGPDAGQ